MRFIDDEYDYMEKNNSTTPFEPMWVDNNNWDFNEGSVPDETPSNEDSGVSIENSTSEMPPSSVMISRIANMPAAQNFNNRFFASFRSKHEIGAGKPHNRKQNPNLLGNDQGFEYEVEATFGSRKQNYKRHGHTRIPNGPWDDLFDADFSKVS